jgi:hypothetical protein
MCQWMPFDVIFEWSKYFGVENIGQAFEIKSSYALEPTNIITFSLTASVSKASMTVVVIFVLNNSDDLETAAVWHLDGSI